MSKYPNCECKATQFSYFRRRYRNGTLHLMRKCRACGKASQNAMRASDYPTEWVNALDIIETDGTGQSVKPTLQSRADTVKSKVNPAQSRAKPVQSRADAVHEKLIRHIQSRTL